MGREGIEAFSQRLPPLVNGRKHVAEWNADVDLIIEHPGRFVGLVLCCAEHRQGHVRQAVPRFL